ncbi:MAG: MurT ligase domain-containing protein [Candidatus Saccharimonadales bacterium]
MSKPYTILLGKTIRSIARLRGGGSALPGLFVEHIDPSFVQETLATLPYGVILISGTNGKTTTTKMVVELLESQGFRVFTNRTGSNFVRGVAAALLGEVEHDGTLRADIAVLELDEAHAVHFVAKIQPKYSLLLNVMRDQLDRFGEIDATTRMLEKIAQATTDGVVLNREDPRVAMIANTIADKTVAYFGLATELRDKFPNDDDLHGRTTSSKKQSAADVTLQSFDNETATFLIDGSEISTPLKLQGIYNIYNGAAALALVRMIVGKAINQPKLIDTLAVIAPAFGRGETLTVNGQPLELVLVKNPSGFRLGLESFSPDGYATMIAINDNYADGRDMSWLWDVAFDSLREHGVAEISGVRAYDMALRMQYDDVAVAHIDVSLHRALAHFLQSHASTPKRIYCTYTAMLALRKELAKTTNVEVIT